MPLTLYRRGKKRTFHYRGTIGPTGRRKFFQGSCHTTDKDIAARQIAEIEAKFWRGNFDGAGAILTFETAAGIYRGARPGVKFLDKVEKYFGATLVKDITSGMIRTAAPKLYPKATGASLNRMVIVPVQAVINHCAESELCPYIKVKRFPESTKVKDPATLEWVKAFRVHASSHLGALALFMFLTGARPSEALGLQWEDVDLSNYTALIRQTKVGTERTAHLPAELVVALATIPRVEGRGVFVYRRYDDFGEAWESTIKRAGIKRLTPHCCRHGFATGLLHRGVDVVTVAKLGGWASAAQVLKTYGHARKETTLADLLMEPEVVQDRPRKERA